MKRTIFLSLLLLSACSAPPKLAIPVPKRKAVKLESPRALAPRFVTAAPVKAVPSWTFEVNGDYWIKASTNLTDWWTLAAVYSATNITINSDTVDKHPTLFYRIQPVE